MSKAKAAEQTVDKPMDADIRTLFGDLYSRAISGEWEWDRGRPQEVPAPPSPEACETEYNIASEIYISDCVEAVGDHWHAKLQQRIDEHVVAFQERTRGRILSRETARALAQAMLDEAKREEAEDAVL